MSASSHDQRTGPLQGADVPDHPVAAGDGEGDAAVRAEPVRLQVAIDATKPEIKASVEALFGVKVLAVNTLVVKGKTKRFRAARASARTGRRRW